MEVILPPGRFDRDGERLRVEFEPFGVLGRIGRLPRPRPQAGFEVEERGRIVSAYFVAEVPAVRREILSRLRRGFDPERLVEVSFQLRAIRLRAETFQQQHDGVGLRGRFPLQPPVERRLVIEIAVPVERPVDEGRVLAELELRRRRLRIVRRGGEHPADERGQGCEAEKGHGETLQKGQSRFSSPGAEAS